MKKSFRIAALLAGALMGSAILSASDLYSKEISIPFAFRVGNVTMPAGTYRVQQEFGKEVGLLLNIQTGRMVQVGFSALRRDGHFKLIFEKTPNGMVFAGSR